MPACRYRISIRRSKHATGGVVHDLADRVYIVCYVAIGSALLETVFSSQLARRGQKPRAVKTDQWSRNFPCVYACCHRRIRRSRIYVGAQGRSRVAIVRSALVRKAHITHDVSKWSTLLDRSGA
jgi:hypothetical protein